jgi:hypothetical protein
VAMVVAMLLVVAVAVCVGMVAAHIVLQRIL